jgi:hypothetical protein
MLFAGKNGPTWGGALQTESNGLPRDGSPARPLTHALVNVEHAFMEAFPAVQHDARSNGGLEIVTGDGSRVTNQFGETDAAFDLTAGGNSPIISRLAATPTPNPSPVSVEGNGPMSKPLATVSLAFPAPRPDTSSGESFIHADAEHAYARSRAAESGVPSHPHATLEHPQDPCDQVFISDSDAKLGTAAIPAPSPSSSSTLDVQGEERQRGIRTSWEACSACALQEGVMSLVTPWGSIPIPPKAEVPVTPPLTPQGNPSTPSPPAYSSTPPPPTAGPWANDPRCAVSASTNFRRYKRHSSISEGNPEGWLSPGQGNAETERPATPGWNPVLGYMRSQTATPRMLSYNGSPGSARSSSVGEWWSPQTGLSIEVDLAHHSRAPYQF